MNEMARPRFVSTAALPDPGRVQDLVDAAHERFPSPTAPPRRCIRRSSEWTRTASGSASPATGQVFTAGDCDVTFPIMSVAKPFTFALVCEVVGPGALRAAVGVNATGLPFDSVEAIERHAGITNPMVNPGAIAAAGLIPGGSLEDRWRTLSDGLSRFAGRELALDEEVLRSASATNLRNRALANS